MATNGLENVNNKKIRINRSDGSLEIQNFYYLSGSSQINVMLTEYGANMFWNTDPLLTEAIMSIPYQPYVVVPDEIYNEINILPPSEIGYSVTKFLWNSRHALVNDKLHIFGGWADDFHKVFLKNIKQLLFC